MEMMPPLSNNNVAIQDSSVLKKIATSMLVSTVLLTSGCAYNQAPVVDLAGVSKQQYEQDLSYCEQFALQVDKGEAGRVGMVNGAATGAGTGAVVGALDDGLGGAVVGSVVGALAGGLSGNASGRVQATEDQARVLRNCLMDKGYKVYDREV